MCGIMGYIGDENDAAKKLYTGLEKLEYRGYDSCGVAVFHTPDVLSYDHHVCAPSEIKKGKELPSSTCGIGHTRWATHGKVSYNNAHPHRSCDGLIFLVHNGIVENSDEIKQGLESEDCEFYSETDTEVLVNLIAFYYRDSIDNKDPIHAISSALKEVEGTYGLAMIFKGIPDTIFAVRRSSPLLLGLKKGASYVSSDVNALPTDIEKVVYLEDGDIARVEKNNFKIYDLNNKELDDRRTAQKIKIKKRHYALGDYSTYLEKEIFEQPDSIRETTRGRFGKNFSSIVLGGINTNRNVKRVLFVGCGSAYHAGLLGKYFIENIAKIPASVEIASEYKYKNNPTEEGTLVVAVSQSGETMDTLSALREARDKGLDTIAITNTVMSSIARMVNEGIYQRVGPEISVASTKTFTSQVTLVLMLSVLLGRKNDMSVMESKRIIKYLRRLPDLMEQTLLWSKKATHRLAAVYQMTKEIIFLGRQYMYPIALEGALKMRELAYLHTNGFTSGEMKHGPLASIRQGSRCIFLAPQEELKDKNIITMKELKVRGAEIILIKQQGQEFPEDCYDEILELPNAPEYLLPVLATVPLQLFSLYMAEVKNLNVDKPRNLAKSVTVE